jgi:hypothetical protein
MLQTIEAMLNKFESGKLSRRQLVVSLATLVVAAKSVAQEKPSRAVSINHITVKVPTLTAPPTFIRNSSECP